MHLIQIFLPRYNNENQLFPSSCFQDLSVGLTEKFGGVTAFLQSPASGLWKENSGKMVKDKIVIFEVMAPEIDQHFWMEFKKEMEVKFGQKEIIIRTSTIQLL